MSPTALYVVFDDLLRYIHNISYVTNLRCLWLTTQNLMTVYFETFCAQWHQCAIWLTIHLWTYQPNFMTSPLTKLNVNWWNGNKREKNRNNSEHFPIARHCYLRKQAKKHEHKTFKTKMIFINRRKYIRNSRKYVPLSDKCNSSYIKFQ